MGAYEADLAAIHDSGYTDPALHGARRLVAELGRSGIEGGVVVDLQRLHPAAEVLDRLRAAGFRARSVIGWEGTRERPGHTAFIARRAG